MPRYRVVLRAFAGWPVETGLAVDAARIEPVSTSKFPANREKNREFRGKKGLPRRFSRPIGPRIQWLTTKFPTQRSREFFGVNREFFTKNREFSHQMAQRWISHF